MAPQVRERILLITVSFALNAILVLTIYFLGVKNVNAKDSDNKIEKKLDKKEFTTFKEKEFIPLVEENKAEHIRIEGINEKRIKDMETRILDNMDDRYDALETLIIETRK